MTQTHVVKKLHCGGGGEGERGRYSIYIYFLFSTDINSRAYSKTHHDFRMFNFAL